jgi:hypothetical protein
MDTRELMFNMDEDLAPRSGRVGLLESRNKLNNLYDSHKFETGVESHNSKPKGVVRCKAYNTKDVGVSAYMDVYAEEFSA